MGISVIIPSLNEAANIACAVGSVHSWASEVIVADGGSTDGTPQIARESEATVVNAPRGRGPQLRAGANAASGEVLLFLHADSWLAEAAGAELQRCILRDRQDSKSDLRPIFGCFHQRIGDDRFRFRLLERGNAFRAKRLAMPYGDQAIFVDRNSYDQVGGVEDVPLMEDVILSQQLRKITRPVLLKGPVHLSARRWQTDGIVRRTLRNWFIFAAFQFGVSPGRLVHWYG